MTKKNIVIVGATSAIAVCCARHWAASEAQKFFLIGRKKSALERMKSDLEALRPDLNVEFQTLDDFTDPSAIEAVVQGIYNNGVVDIALISHGALTDQESCQSDLSLCRQTIELNGVSPALWAEAFASRMEHRNHGKLVLMASVAGDRGRRTNYVYGAAKGLVTRYAQGLQHRLHGSAVKVILIKPGPTDTPMTERFKAKGMRMADVETVARDILRSVERGKPEIYTPKKWWMIMMVIRHLPRSVFNLLHI